MNAPAGVLLIIAIGILLVLLFKQSIPRKVYTSLFIGYFAFLLFALIVSEFLETNTRANLPFKVDDPFHFINSDKIINKEDIDPSTIIEKREHQANSTLIIENEHNGALVFIERIGIHHQLIEEILYKPQLIIEFYNFSNVLEINKPSWEGNTVRIPKQLGNTLTYVSYFNAELTNQFINSDNSSLVGYGPIWSPLIVHLKVPENIEVISNNEEMTHYIDE